MLWLTEGKELDTQAQGYPSCSVRRNSALGGTAREVMSGILSAAGYG